MAYAESGKLDVDFTRVDTEAKHTLGEEQPGSDGNTYIYCKSGTSPDGTAGYSFLLDESFVTANCTTTAAGSNPQRVVFSQATEAISPGEYFWCVSHGRSFKVFVAASCAADVKLYTTASATVLDDAVTTLVEGVRLTTAATTTGPYAATATGPCSVNTQS